ncbi:MAG: biliverdin-producing heme oxygenase [Phycisphaeraceae bacterium]|nr:biliverdin-producing heme oxygenase [Phycisphaeraceae bacterium]
MNTTSQPGTHGTSGTPGNAGATGIMERLKVETSGLHAAAEQNELQRLLAKGQLPREMYGAWLGQMLHVHRALEAAIGERAAGCPAIEAVVTREQFDEARIAADLRALGFEVEQAVLPATAALCERIDELRGGDPVMLLGMHYVLEGSHNGGQFIARNVRKAYELTPGTGDTYLDPYGARQREEWGMFKTKMGEIGFTPEQADGMVDAAQEMFRAIGAISDDLMRVGVGGAR